MTIPQQTLMVSSTMLWISCVAFAWLFDLCSYQIFALSLCQISTKSDRRVFALQRAKKKQPKKTIFQFLRQVSQEVSFPWNRELKAEQKCEILHMLRMMSRDWTGLASARHAKILHSRPRDSGIQLFLRVINSGEINKLVKWESACLTAVLKLNL